MPALGVRPNVDTTDFRSGINSMRGDLRLLEGDFRANTASLGDWSKSATALEQRIETLNNKIGVQQKIVAATRAEYERLVAANGATSNSAREMEIKLNKETETLGKMEHELGATNAQLGKVKTESDQAGKGVQGMAQEEAAAVTVTELFDATLGALKVTLGVVMAVLALAGAGLLAMGAAGVEAVKAISTLETQSADAADKLAELSAQTGISTDKLQEMNFVGKLLGTGIEAFTGSQAKMIRSMAAARDGTGAQADAFKRLGIRVVDANGQLRDSQTVFGEVLDALGRLQSPTERDAAAMDIFGKSAQELNPLINAGSQGIAEMSKRAGELGAVVDDETVQALSGFKDQLDALDLGLKGTGATIAGGFLPYFKELGSAGETALADLSSRLKGARGLNGMVKAVSEWFVDAANEFARTAPQAVKNIADTINRNMPILIPALVQGLVAITGALAQMAPVFANMAIVILTTLGNSITTNAPVLAPSMLQLGSALGDLLVQSMPTLAPAMAQAALTIIVLLMAALGALVNKLGDAGIKAALKFVDGIAAGVAGGISVVILAGLKLLLALYNGFINNLGRLSAIGSLVGNMLAGVINGAVDNMFNAGASLVDGLWRGIQAEWQDLLNKIQSLVNDLVNLLKSILGIASPSKVTFAFGKFVSQGLGDGITEEMTRVKRQVGSAMRDLNASMAMNALQLQFSAGAGAGKPGAGGSNSYSDDHSFQLHANQVVFQGDQKPGTVAAAAKSKSRRY